MYIYISLGTLFKLAHSLMRNFFNLIFTANLDKWRHRCDKNVVFIYIFFRLEDTKSKLQKFQTSHTSHRRLVLVIAYFNIFGSALYNSCTRDVIHFAVNNIIFRELKNSTRANMTRNCLACSNKFLSSLSFKFWIIRDANSRVYTYIGIYVALLLLLL